MKSPWPAIVIAFIVIAVLAASTTIFGFVLTIAAIGVPVVLVLCGLVYIVKHLKPPGWVIVLYLLSWLIIPGIALAITLVVGVFGGVAFFLEKLGK